MKVVIDSNVLASALGKKSYLRPIWDAFINGFYQLIVSEDILKEYEEILQKRATPGAAGIVMDIFIESSKVVYQQIYYSWNAIKQDPDDNKFFDVAVAGNADYLVTNDAHFNILEQLSFPKVKVIRADEFLELLS